MHSHDGNEEKGEKLFKTWNVFATLPRSYSVFLPVQYNVDASLYSTSLLTRALAESRPEQPTSFRPSSYAIFDMTNAFPFPNCFSCTCTITSFVPLSPLSHKAVCLETRSGCAQVGQLSWFYFALSSPSHSPSICSFDIILHPSPRPLIDTLRSRPAYIFSNPTLI